MRRDQAFAFWTVGGAIGAALLAMSVSPAPAQGQQACEIRVQDSGRVNNASTSSADLNAVADDSRLTLGRNVFFDDGTSVSGAFVRLGNGASVFDVNADSLHTGKGATVRGDQSPFSAGGAFCAAPAVVCGGLDKDVSVPRKGSKSLTPGTYGQVTLGNGASLNLAPGTYSVCQIRAGRNVTVEVTGATQSIINVRDEVRIQNGSSFGPVGSTPTPLLNVAPGDTVRIGKHATVQAFITAPSARLDLGNGTTFTGAACVQELSAGRNVNIECVSTTTTTTTPPTTSSSSTTSTLVTTTTSTAPTVTTTTSTTTTTTLYGSPSRAFMVPSMDLLD
ncbi:MAG TPA: hypothetical protein VKE22_13145 [Haliangiales bacterium]|nr:hypothetical protein [Haliangiales bacterium]